MASACDPKPGIANFVDRFDINYHNLVENTKTVLIQTLREVFANDPVHPYRSNPEGFPIMPSFRLNNGEHGGIDGVEWGNDPTDTITSIVITDVYRYDTKFLPAITLKLSSSNNNEISFNQEWGSLKWGERQKKVGDQIVLIKIPTDFIFSGSWKQNFIFTITAEDTLTREQLADKLSLILLHIKRRELAKKGVFVESVSVGGESEEQADDTNENYYVTTVSVSVLTEWRREIPIFDVVEQIQFNFDVFNSVLSATEIKLLKAYYNNNGLLSEFYSTGVLDQKYYNSSTTTFNHGQTVYNDINDLLDDLL